MDDELDEIMNNLITNRPHKPHKTKTKVLGDGAGEQGSGFHSVIGVGCDITVTEKR